MKRQYKIGKTEVTHYFMPGKYCDDLSLKRIHSAMVAVNEKSGANVVNKMLNKQNTLEEIRIDLQNTIIAIGLMDDLPCAFVITPILNSYEGKPVVHAGLVVIAKNPGMDFVDLMAFGNYSMAYQQLGGFYATNITSTPGILETFESMVPGSWPSPDAKLKVAPKGFREVVKILKDEYMDKYFSNPEKLNVDYKRFILTSNSQEMGFTTNFHKIQRSNNVKYLLFCHAWVNYEKEEDIIQVGEINFYKYLRMIYFSYVLKRDLKKAERTRNKINSKPSNQIKVNDERKAA